MPPPPGRPPELDRCHADDGKAADCRAALEKLAAAPQPPKLIFDTYKKACDKKAKLLGCGVFKSTAVTDADHPTMEALMACEAGRTDDCEGLKPSAAPLVAWHKTLKTDWCKKGANALCDDYRQCKSSKWKCDAIGPGGGQACGCAPACEGPLAVSLSTSKTWPDGSTRATFTCPSAPKK